MVLALVAVAYLPALMNGLITDDNALVLRRAEALKSVHGLAELVSNVYWWGAGEVDARHDLYRPMVSATWWLDYQLSGTSPFAYHFSSYVVHLANTALTYAVLAPLAGAGIALGVAALFGAGPVAVMSVGWASGRTDLWATLFVLLFLWFFFRARERQSTIDYFLAAVSFLLALASKEGAVIAPFIALALDRTKHDKSKPGESAPWPWGRYVLLMIPLAVYLIIRLAAVGSIIPRDAPAGEGLGSHISTAAEAILRTAWHALVPMHFSYWSELPWSAAGGAALIAMWTLLVAWALLIGYGLGKRRLWAAGGLWFILTLLPVYLTGQHWAPQSDFYAYAGLPGLWLFVIDGVRDLWLRRMPVRTRVTPLVYVVAGVGVLFALLTFLRLPILKSDFTLASHMVKREPQSTRALMIMGEQYFAIGDGVRGAAYMRQAADVNPQNLQPWMKTASFFLSKRDLSAAAPYVDTLAARGPESSEALAVVGRFYFEAGQCEKAVETYRRSLALSTPTAYTLYDYGMALLCTNANEEAAQAYKSALQVRPSWPEALMNLGLAYENSGRLDDARAAYEEVLRQAPQLAEGWESLAIVNAKRGDVAAARNAADRYYRLSPPRDRVERLQNILGQSAGQGKP